MRFFVERVGPILYNEGMKRNKNNGLCATCGKKITGKFVICWDCARQAVKDLVDFDFSVFALGA
jgi:predicted amidophosphoribosyltransferase